jgi:hypothetical protein
MAGLGTGMLLRGRELRGSCGGDEIRLPGGEVLSCGTCPKREASLCGTEEPLVALALASHPDPTKHSHS